MMRATPQMEQGNGSVAAQLTDPLPQAHCFALTSAVHKIGIADRVRGARQFDVLFGRRDQMRQPTFIASCEQQPAKQQMRVWIGAFTRDQQLQSVDRFRVPIHCQ